MIAYLFWHCAYPTTTAQQYEEALMRFQQRLGQQQPPGFGGSASFRLRRILCNVDPDQRSPVQPNNDEGIEQVEADGRDNE